MTAFLTIASYVLVAALAIFELSEAGRYYAEKKWGWFGISTYLAIYLTAWIIHHSFS